MSFAHFCCMHCCPPSSRAAHALVVVVVVIVVVLLVRLFLLRLQEESRKRAGVSRCARWHSVAPAARTFFFGRDFSLGASLRFSAFAGLAFAFALPLPARCTER